MKRQTVYEEMILQLNQNRILKICPEKERGNGRIENRVKNKTNNKADINSEITIISLNLNDLNTSIKRQRLVEGIFKNNMTDYMVYTKVTSNVVI